MIITAICNASFVLERAYSSASRTPFGAPAGLADACPFTHRATEPPPIKSGRHALCPPPGPHGQPQVQCYSICPIRLHGNRITAGVMEVKYCQENTGERDIYRSYYSYIYP